MAGHRTRFRGVVIGQQSSAAKSPGQRGGAVRDTQRIYTLLRSAGRELRLQPKTIATSLVGNGETA